MKANKLFMTVFSLAVSSSAFAQFSNSSSSVNVGNSTSSNEDYNRVTVSYVMGTFDYDGVSVHNDLNEPSGISFGITHGQSISATAPLFFEYGANVTWLHGSEESDYDYYGYYDYSVSLNTLDITVPVNLAYRFNVSEEFSIVPFVGPSARINIMSKVKAEDSDYSESVSYFDKKDVGKNAVWNRVQIGGQVGAGIYYNKFYFGYQYQWDFSELSKKMKSNRNYISVGVNF